MRASENEPSAKAWTKKRILTTAELRGATLPSGAALNGLAAAIEEFPQPVIEKALKELERTPFEPYAPHVITENEVVMACKKAKADSVPKSKFCGRCIDGRIRISGKVERCVCCCADCENSGIRIVTLDGRKAQPGSKEDRYAQRCPCQRPVAQERTA